MIKNQIIEDAYNKLLETHTISESNYILTNSLAILGDKKVVIQESEEIDKVSIDRINKYKYPERLASFINITNEKTEDWKELSFTKLAFS